MTTSTIDELPSDQSVYVFPTSFIQEGLWVLDQLEPQSPVYNSTTALRIRRRLDAAILHRSLNEIVQRHEVLRTTFRTIQEEDHSVQVVAPWVFIPLTEVDLQGLPEDQREA